MKNLNWDQIHILLDALRDKVAKLDGLRNFYDDAHEPVPGFLTELHTEYRGTENVLLAQLSELEDADGNIKEPVN